MNLVPQQGKVIYNEFHVDFSKPYREQPDNLTEDLLQIEFPDQYLLDVGWYPEYDADGAFMVQLIRNDEWDKPLYCCRCRTRSRLLEGMEEAVKAVFWTD